MNREGIVVALVTATSGICILCCAAVCCWRDATRRSRWAYQHQKDGPVRDAGRAIKDARDARDAGRGAAGQEKPKALTPRPDGEVLAEQAQVLITSYQAPVRRLDKCARGERTQRTANNAEKAYNKVHLGSAGSYLGSSGETDHLARAFGQLAGEGDDEAFEYTTPRSARSQRSRASEPADVAAELERAARRMEERQFDSAPSRLVPTPGPLGNITRGSHRLGARSREVTPAGLGGEDLEGQFGGSGGSAAPPPARASPAALAAMAASPPDWRHAARGRKAAAALAARGGSGSPAPASPAAAPGNGSRSAPPVLSQNSQESLSSGSQAGAFAVPRPPESPPALRVGAGSVPGARRTAPQPAAKREDTGAGVWSNPPSPLTDRYFRPHSLEGAAAAPVNVAAPVALGNGHDGSLLGQIELAEPAADLAEPASAPPEKPGKERQRSRKSSSSSKSGRDPDRDGDRERSRDREDASLVENDAWVSQARQDKFNALDAELSMEAEIGRAVLCAMDSKTVRPTMLGQAFPQTSGGLPSVPGEGARGRSKTPKRRKSRGVAEETAATATPSPGPVNKQHAGFTPAPASPGLDGPVRAEREGRRSRKRD